METLDFHRFFRASGLGVLVFCSLVGSAGAETTEDVAAIERAHVATEEVRKNFKAALKKALAEGGPVKAISACKVEAPKITPEKKGDAAETITVGRTSHRIRNPKNVPQDWMKPYLEKFSKGKRSGIPKHELVKLGENHYGYLEPIFVEPICLNCHGPNLTKDVRDAIRKDYPDDKAVGFNVGDFRGLLWVEMRK